jgi:PKD repeat protein
MCLHRYYIPYAIPAQTALNNTIRKFSPTGVDLGDFATTGLHFPHGLAFDPAGNLYVANSPNNTIREFSPAGVDLGNFATTGLNFPTSLAFYPQGAPQPPTVVPPANQSSAEGASHTFNLGSFTDPDGGPWSVNVDWGDSTAHTIFNMSSPGTITPQNHTYGEEGSYTVTVKVTDTLDGQFDFKTSTINVSDPAVMATGEFKLTPVEGAPFTGQTVARFTDPGGPEPVGNYSADINWGDGTGNQVGAGSISFAAGVFTVKGSHTYAEESGPEHPNSQPYQITVTIHHEGALTATATSTATVSDPPVVATGGFAFSAKECILSVVQTVATFTDPGGPEVLGDYSATIDWGDSSPTSTGTITLGGGGVFTVSGNHTYAEEGTFTITTTINHEGIITKVTSTATVRDNYGLLLLDPSDDKALMVTGNGNVTVNNCGAIVVDSRDPSAIFLTGNATVSAAETDVAGDLVTHDHASLSGELNHEAATPDPLGLALPPIPSTHFAAVHVSSSIPLPPLSPGTYDGGIEVTGDASVTLLPGIYYLNGGGFSVSDHGSVTGSGVLIVNAPNGSSDTISVTGQASVALTAPTGLTGALANYNGIVLFQDPASANPISVDGQASLTIQGVLYAPKALLKIDGNGNAVVSTVTPTTGGEVIVFDAMVTVAGDLTINADPAPTFQLAAEVSAAGLTAGSSGLLSSRANLRTGELLVAIDDASGALSADEQARIDDAFRSINAALRPFGVDLMEAFGADRARAAIHLTIASTSDVGGVANGVLGVTEHGNTITLVSGWNWYLGADPAALGSNQYDFETVVAHELGHAVGLGEGSDPSSVMYPYLATGVARRTLTSTDLRVIADSNGEEREPLPADLSSGVTGSGFSASGLVPIDSGVNIAPNSGASTPRSDGASATDMAFVATAIAGAREAASAAPPLEPVAGNTDFTMSGAFLALNGPMAPAVVIVTVPLSPNGPGAPVAATRGSPALDSDPSGLLLALACDAPFAASDWASVPQPVLASAPRGCLKAAVSVPPAVLRASASSGRLAEVTVPPAALGITGTAPSVLIASDDAQQAPSLLATAALALGLVGWWRAQERPEDQEVRRRYWLK